MQGGNNSHPLFKGDFLKTVKYKFTGVSPILFHNVNSMDLVKPKSMKHSEFEKSPEMFRARLYMEGETLTLPSRMILGGLKTAAQKSGIRQDGKRSSYASVMRAVVFCMEPAIIKQKFSEVETHSEYVSIMKAKVLRIFPMLKKWEATIEFTFDETQISLEALEEILNYCGSYCGFGDYRPQYGRFSVSKIK